MENKYLTNGTLNRKGRKRFRQIKRSLNKIQRFQRNRVGGMVDVNIGKRAFLPCILLFQLLYGGGYLAAYTGIRLWISHRSLEQFPDLLELIGFIPVVVASWLLARATMRFMYPPKWIAAAYCIALEQKKIYNLVNDSPTFALAFSQTSEPHEARVFQEVDRRCKPFSGT